MLKTGNVVCLACGGKIEEYDTIDIDTCESTVVLFKVGECVCCGAHHQWHEEYIRTGYRDLEQNYDEPDDVDDDCGFDPYLGCWTGDC